MQPADWMAIHRRGAEAFLDGFGGSDASDEAYHRWIDSPTFDPSLFVVAWDGSEVAAGRALHIEPAENERDGTLERLARRRVHASGVAQPRPRQRARRAQPRAAARTGHDHGRPGRRSPRTPNRGASAL